MEETPGGPDTPEQTKKQRDAPVIAGNYQIGQQIGKGGFATVHKAINLITGEVVAAKRFDATQVSKSALATITEEADLIKTLNHPNIVRFIELVKKKDLLVLVLEFVEGGSVASLVDQYGCLPEPVCLVYAPQVLTGMDYLHQRGVIHRDIKGSNILITKSGQAKLADFGVSSLLNDIEKRFSVVGTPYWMPPEVVDLKGWHTQGDIWSFGCTVIEMLTGVPPHFSCPPMAAMFKIVEEEVPIPTEGISAELQDFLKQCFIKEFTARPPAAKLLTHQWISRVKEAAIPTDLPAVQSRLRGMTLQIEEADANKLRERLDADALNYMKLRESAFVHNGPSLRASQRVPLGVALDAESARNEIKKLEAAVHAEEMRRAGTDAAVRGNQPRSQTSPPSSARGSGSGAATISPSGSGVALAWKRADTMSKKDLKERDSKDSKDNKDNKEKDKGAKLTKEDSSSSVIGRVFGAKTVSSATAKEMKSSEKYKSKLAEVKAERDRLKKKVDEQEDELDKLRLALSKTRTELEEQRTKVTALHGALEHLVKKDEARERAATSHSSVNFKVEAPRLALPIDRKESSTNLEKADRKDSGMKPTTPRTARDSTAPLKADIITPRAKDSLKRDAIVSPSRTQRSDTTGLFGVPLETVLERQKARHPELRVPQLIDAGLRFLVKHVSTEGLFRIGGTHNRIQELATKAAAGDIEFDVHEVPHNVSALVTKFLRELPEPLLTAAAYDSYITAIDAPEPLTLISNLVRGLPFSSQFLLRDVCRFCSMVAYNAEYNKMSLDNIGRVLGPNILIGPAEQSLQRMQADADAVARVAALLVKSWRLVFSHIAEVPKEENFEFKFRTSHAKSVQGLTACTTRSDVIVWTWDSSGALCAWSGRNFEQLRTHQPDPKRGMVSAALAVGGEVWLAAERAVTVMDGETGQVVWEDTSPGTSAFGFALDGDNLWVATWPGIRCYSRKTRAVVKSADTTKELKVLHVAGGALWVAGSKSTLIYDCETLTQIREVKEHSRRVNAFVAIGPARFVSVSDDQKCIVWDAMAKTAVKVLEGHEGKVMCAAHAPNASVFFTASWDTSVRVWDTQTLSCLRVMKGYHTDCISGLSAFWEPQLGDWLLWTSSWDKHICSFKITAPVPTKSTNSGSLPVLSLPPAGPETPGAAPVVSPGRSPRSKTVDGHGEGREKKEKSPRQHKHHEHKERSDTASAATLAPPGIAASASPSPSPPPAAGAAPDAAPASGAGGDDDDDLSVSYIDLQRKMKENEARLAELHAKKKALGK